MSPAFFVGAVYGYDSVANGATIAMPAFLIYFGEATPDGHFFLPSIWTSLWTAMSGLAQVIGGFCIVFVIDSFGRSAPLLPMDSSLLLEWLSSTHAKALPPCSLGK
jgi:hypothetical protein